MEAKFTAKHVWDVRAARALLRAAQKTPLWKIGAACAASGLALLAVCWALGARRLGFICFCVLALFGAYAAFGLEPMAARSLFTQRRRRWDAAALAFGEELVAARSELWRCDFRYGSFRRFALCRGRYLLFYRAQQALIFTPESIAGGDAAAFCAFIREKTGLTLENAR